MKEFSASTVIEADAESIWQILTDAGSYPAWDPWAERIEGTIAPGETIRAYTKLAPGRAFPAKVTVFEPPHRMEWTGGMPLGLFKGVRTFSVTPREDGRTEVRVAETFSGLLLPLFARSLPDMTEPFGDFVAGLKTRAEAH